jgi:hypothetical protein
LGDLEGGSELLALYNRDESRGQATSSHRRRPRDVFITPITHSPAFIGFKHPGSTGAAEATRPAAAKLRAWLRSFAGYCLTTVPGTHARRRRPQADLDNGK